MFVLNRRKPPPLLLLVSKHPRGYHDDEGVFTVVSDQPTCPAAASHAALSAIHPYPLSAHVPEVTTAYTVVCRPAILLHELLEASQKRPVVASQLVVPHAQFLGLTAVPSVVAQATKRHWFSLAKQKSPVVAASQSVVPHAQLAGLAAVPFLMAQVGTELQRSSFDVSQMSPVADVQAPEAPQTQGAGLAVAPSAWGQAGPVKAHRQAWEL